MNRLERIETIKKLGFSEYESKCYLALFERESLTVSEIAGLADIPRPNAYEALKKLLARGLSVSLPGKTRKYAAADPQLFRKKSHQALDDSKKTVDSLASELDSLFKRGQGNNSPLEYIEILKDPMQVHRRYLELFEVTEKEIMTFSKPPFSYKAQPHKVALSMQKEQHQKNYEAMKKGIVEKSIWEIKAFKEVMLPFLRELRKPNLSGLTRAVEKLPIKMAVFDRKFVLYQLEDPVAGNPSTTSLVTEHHSLANVFAELFESYWKKAKPVDNLLTFAGDDKIHERKDGGDHGTGN